MDILDDGESDHVQLAKAAKGLVDTVALASGPVPHLPRPCHRGSSFCVCLVQARGPVGPVLSTL